MLHIRHYGSQTRGPDWGVRLWVRKKGSNEEICNHNLEE
jgi:hypothetical protein